jgi:probable HAF family extracellular repeat protein
MTVWDLGTFSGGMGSWVGDINNLGVAVGWGDMSGWNQQHPMMVALFGQKAMQWVDLGTLGADGGEAFGVSNTGIIVGHSYTVSGDDHAFVWTSQTGMVDLGALADLGHTQSQALDVNRAGTLIVGWSASPDRSDTRPVVWTPSTQRTQQGPVTTWEIHQLDASALGLPFGSVTAVNNHGQMVGNCWSNSAYANIVWNPVRGRKEWKPVQLPGSADYPNLWSAEINERGEVVGGSYTPDWNYGPAALWQPVDGTKTIYKFVPLANPWGLLNGDGGIGINNRGDIVGVVVDENWSGHGAQWRTSDPSSVVLMPMLPDQTWSYLANLDEVGIAAGGYGTADFMHGVAVQLH